MRGDSLIKEGIKKGEMMKERIRMKREGDREGKVVRELAGK